MRKREALGHIKRAQESVRGNIESVTDRSSQVARAVAREGYQGGYADALSDVVLLLNGTIPNRRNYWRREDV